MGAPLRMVITELLDRPDGGKDHYSRYHTLNLTACVPVWGRAVGSQTTLNRADAKASNLRPNNRTCGAGSLAEGLMADPGGAPILIPLTWIGSPNLICMYSRCGLNLEE